MTKNKALLSFSAISFSLIICINLLAADNSIIEILGRKFEVYKAKNGETLFGVARENNWNDSVLQKFNPSIVSPLKKGDRIFYPTDDKIFSMPVNTTREVIVYHDTLFHTVKKGETVYSISNQYNISLDSFYELNPQSRNGINPDDKVLIGGEIEKVLEVLVPEITEIPERIQPQEEINETKVNEDYYTIKAGDTVLSIAIDKNVSVFSLLSLNPGLVPEKITVGDVIRLPEWGEGIELINTTVEEKRVEGFNPLTLSAPASWQEIAVKFNIDTVSLQAVNPDVNNLKKNSKIIIPEINSYMVDRIMPSRDKRENNIYGIRQIYNDVHRITNNDTIFTLKMAILTDSATSKKDIEFIRGFLSAVKKFKNNMEKISVKIFDGRGADDMLISELTAYDPTMIFTTYDKNIPLFVGKYAISHRTPVVNAFDIKNEEYLENPYMIQMLMSANDFNETVAKNAYLKYNGYKLVFVGEEDPNDMLSILLKQYWDPSNIKYLPTSSLEALNDTPDDRILFYGYSVNKDEIKQLITSVLELMAKNTEADYNIFGRPNWMLFTNQLSEDFHKVNLTIPTRFYIDEKSGVFNQFCGEFMNLYNVKPMMTVPVYAAAGYDLASYFINALTKSEKDINSIVPSRKLLQNKLNLKRVGNWAGMINKPVFFITYQAEQPEECIVIE